MRREFDRLLSDQMSLLANSLRLSTVAEGIESPLQLERLRQLGCRYGQGFIWSGGLRTEDAFAWMIDRNAHESHRRGRPYPKRT